MREVFRPRAWCPANASSPCVRRVSQARPACNAQRAARPANHDASTLIGLAHAWNGSKPRTFSLFVGVGVVIWYRRQSVPRASGRLARASVDCCTPWHVWTPVARGGGRRKLGTAHATIPPLYKPSLSLSTSFEPNRKERISMNATHL